MIIKSDYILDKIFTIEENYLFLKDRLKEYVNLLIKICNATYGAIFLREELSQKMKMCCSSGIESSIVEAINSEYAGRGFESLLEETLEKKKPIIREKKSNKLKLNMGKKESCQIMSVMSLPLIINNNLLGILQIGKNATWHPGETDAKNMHHISRFITQSIYREELEKEIKRTKSYLANLLSSSPSNIITTDIHGHFTYISSSTEELFGYKPFELIGRPVKNFYVGGEAQAQLIMDLLKKNEIIKNYEVQVYKSDGTKVYIKLSASLIKDEKGNIIGTIGICDDISEHKKLIRVMRDQTQHLANIMADSADAIVSIDNDNIIKSWNKGAEEIFGYTSQEMVGHSFHKMVPKELLDKDELDKIRQEVYEKGFIRNYETYRIRKDGRKIFVNITRTAIKDENGNIIGSSAIIRDITKMRELQRQLIHSEKLATIGRLSAALAHEIKNPLAGISGAIQVIGENIPEKDSRQEIIKEILRQTKRLDNTINHLLLYSKPRPLNKVYYNIHTLLDQVIIVLQQEPQMEKVEIVRCYDKEFTKAFIDPQQMEQVFMNIIINSLQAMPRGGKLTITTDQQRNKQLISFADTGVGIAAGMVLDIFEPFYTTKHRGTGLGLNISYNIVKSHGGTIKVKSELGKGAIFTIVLPRE
jgi:PAS domain S-box-containing protein